MDSCEWFSSPEERLHRHARHRYNILQRLGSILCCRFGRHSGNYLAFSYILVKLFYIGNAVGQLFLLNVFMGRGFYLLGFEAIQRWWNSEDIQAVERFPRVTMCKFSIRTLGDNIQPFDVQCLLPINIYNEKVLSFAFVCSMEWRCRLLFVDLSSGLVLASIRGDRFGLWSDQMVVLLFTGCSNELRLSISQSEWNSLQSFVVVVVVIQHGFRSWWIDSYQTSRWIRSILLSTRRNSSPSADEEEHE